VTPRRLVFFCAIANMASMSALTTIPNIGPATETMLTKVGITTAEQLQALGADAAYVRLMEHGTRPHFIGYYVLHMALQGRPWNDCKGDEKKALRKQFDALKSTGYDSAKSELETFMNQFGLLPVSHAK
jgi:DNA transformation protein and related proteins